jgi:hypothetical protein
MFTDSQVPDYYFGRDLHEGNLERRQRTRRGTDAEKQSEKSDCLSRSSELRVWRTALSFFTASSVPECLLSCGCNRNLYLHTNYSATIHGLATEDYSMYEKE